MTVNRNLLSEAVRFGLAAGAVGLIGAVSAPAAHAQQTQATELDRIEVTGSRIKRAEIEGPSPISVISREDIDVSGEISVADFLRQNVYNSFGSFRESSGSATGSFAAINLRGIGSVYTLVLIDGRRMTPSPTQAGGAANINLIPMAAVERIEILREGAGAVYGSDAIGGVVNIILRKDFEGLVVGGGTSRPSRGPDENTANIVGGTTSDRGNMTISVDHQSRGMMFNEAVRDLIDPALWVSGLSIYSSAANSQPLAGGAVEGAPNCETFENEIFIPALDRCGFDHGATSANEASLHRDSMMLNGNYEITDNTSLFFRAISSETNSLGVYAAAPVAGSTPLPTIAADNPNNPFGDDRILFYRFTPLGTRDSERRDTLRDVTIGLQGFIDVFGGADWDFGVTHGRVRQVSTGYNYGIFSALQAAIDSGDFNPFVPTDPGVAAAAPSIGHTVIVESNQRTFGADGSIAFNLWDMAHGPVGFVTGFDYRDDRLDQTFDPQSAANNVFGSAGAGTGGSRAYYAVYFESLIPLLSTLNLTLAGRYDSYNDFGSNFSPRVSLEFRPVDSLLFRGSWGEGFRAPTLDDLYGDISSTNLAIGPVPGATPPHPGGDERACAALTAVRADPTVPDNYQPYPVDPCSTAPQYTFFVGSNPNLLPEDSRNWGLGVVFSPTDALSISLDYWDIEITNQIANVPNGMAARWGEDGTGAPFGVTRGNPITAPNGTVLPGAIQQILNPIANVNTRTARGLDLDALWRFNTAGAGMFTTHLVWSHMLEFELETAVSTIVQRGNLGFPKDRAQLALGWEMADFGFNVVSHHVGGHGPIGSWNTFDVQANWNTPWNGRVAAGVRNVTNKTPQIGSVSGFPFYSNQLYNAWGRVPYLRYEQRF